MDQGSSLEEILGSCQLLYKVNCSCTVLGCVSVLFSDTVQVGVLLVLNGSFEFNTAEAVFF